MNNKNNNNSSPAQPSGSLLGMFITIASIKKWNWCQFWTAGKCWAWRREILSSLQPDSADYKTKLYFYQGSPIRYSAACQPTWWFSDQYCIGPSQPISWIQTWICILCWWFLDQYCINLTHPALASLNAAFTLFWLMVWKRWSWHLVVKRREECLWRQQPHRPSLAGWAVGSPSTFEMNQQFSDLINI